jgi:16S rRNA (adenine1518-N6/adenine1519-N6)-dimethyltransferase
VIRARKRFGQHFLEPAWVDKLIRAIDPQPDQTFIEIGPGRGALTRPLAARAKEVIAHEIDRDLARELSEAAIPNVRVVQGDFLETFPSSARSPITNVISPESAVTTSPNPQSPVPNHLLFRVAGSLPYNVASPIMFKLVDAYLEGVPLVDATLMLQLEVAERLVAQAGTKTYGVLSVLIRHCAKVDLLLKLPPGAFRPPPKVRSAVVRLNFHPPDPPVRDREMFERIVQTVFTQRRKTLANALRSWGQARGQSPSLSPGLSPGQSLDLSRRPETLTVAEFAALADVFSSP